MNGIRHFITGAMACLAMVLAGHGAPAAHARSQAQVNAIIRSLAPISGQTISKGYRASPRRSWRTFTINRRRVVVDYAYMAEFEVYFPYDSARLTRRARNQLWALGRALQSPRLAPYSYVIAGHTDARGSRAYNRRLSYRRARAVRNYLVNVFGIDPDRLLVIGLGEDSLKDPRHPYSSVNRRVEVVMVVSGAGRGRTMAPPPAAEEPADAAMPPAAPAAPAQPAPRPAQPAPRPETPNDVLHGAPAGALPPCTRAELQDLDDYQRKPGVDCMPPPGWKPKN